LFHRYSILFFSLHIYNLLPQSNNKIEESPSSITMASHAPGSCCYKGVKHEGQPVGSLSTVKDFEVYTSYPENKSTDYAVLMYVFPSILSSFPFFRPLLVLFV
jgi:hypothetical protein